MAFIEAYVTNLGKYNEGELASEPLKFPTTTEEVQALLKRIGVDNIQYEEIFIADYAGYFFTRFSEDNRQNAENAVQAYIRNINRIFVEEFKEAAPLDENAKIEILFGQAAQTFREEAYQQQINGESTEIEIDLIDWCSDMLYKEGYEDIELMTEALYHINCDYLLSDYLQWPMYDTKRENPFRPYFELWKMGLNIYFPERGRVVLIG